MKAIELLAHGGPEILDVRQVPDPTPGEAEVCVDVEVIGVNYADTLWRRGQYDGSAPPTIPGMEVAGTVVATGAGVAWPQAGDRVVALLFDGGGYAERAVAPAAHCLPLPPHWSWERGAGACLQHLTAYHSLVTMGRASRDEICLIHAAAGGVGGAAVELARSLGLRVVATASTDEKRQIAARLGAERVTDYEGFADVVADLGGADVILESVGGHVLKRSLQVLRPFGRLVALGIAGRRPASIPETDLLMHTRTVAGFHLSAVAGRGDLLRSSAAEVMRRVDEGSLTVRIGATFPLEEARRAHELLESRASTGKILLRP